MVAAFGLWEQHKLTCRTSGGEQRFWWRSNGSQVWFVASQLVIHRCFSSLSGFSVSPCTGLSTALATLYMLLVSISATVMIGRTRLQQLAAARVWHGTPPSPLSQSAWGPSPSKVLTVAKGRTRHKSLPSGRVNTRVKMLTDRAPRAKNRAPAAIQVCFRRWNQVPSHQLIFDMVTFSCRSPPSNC